MRQLFGRSSEKMTPDQMELVFEELCELQDALDEAEEKLVELDDEKESRRGKRKPLRERIPEDRPTERVVIVPDEVKADPHNYKKIGEETVEELDVTPPRHWIKSKIYLIANSPSSYQKATSVKL